MKNNNKDLINIKAKLKTVVANRRDFIEDINEKVEYDFILTRNVQMILKLKCKNELAPLRIIIDYLEDDFDRNIKVIVSFENRDPTSHDENYINPK